MRVLHAISSLHPSMGGPTTALLGMAAAQARAGIQVSIVATWMHDPCDALAADLQSQNIHVTRVGPAKDPMTRHPDLPKILNNLIAQTDIVHTHAMWESIQHHAARIAHLQGVPFVMTPHGMLDSWNMSNGALRKKLYLKLRMRKNLNRAAAIHFATEMERDSVARLHLKPPPLIIPFGLNTDEFAQLPPPGTFTAQHPQLAGKKIIAFLGRLDYGKGLEILIPAFAALNSPEAVLVIIGPDSLSGYRAKVEQLIAQHNLTDKVLLTGMLKGQQKLAALVDSYVLCQPSYHENFGIAVIEALACNTPAIISDQIYIHPQLSQAGVAQVTPLQTPAVTAALQSLLSNPSARNIQSAKCRAFALQTYDWQKIGETWAQSYTTFTKENRATSPRSMPR